MPAQEIDPDPSQWHILTHEHWTAHRVTLESDLNCVHAPNPPCSGGNTANTTRAPAVDPVRDFQKGIKHDPNVFTALTQDEDFCNWNNKTLMQAAAQGVEEVFDPAFTHVGAQAVAAFNLNQTHVMSVFMDDLQNTKGHKLVCEHTDTADVQKVCKELCDHCLSSTKVDAKLKQSNLFLLNTDACNWKGSWEDFIAHFKDAANEHNEKCKRADVLSSSAMVTALQCAVLGVPMLAQVVTNGDQADQPTPFVTSGLLGVRKKKLGTRM